jgi:hypothetical protein
MKQEKVKKNTRIRKKKIQGLYIVVIVVSLKRIGMWGTRFLSLGVNMKE